MKKITIGRSSDNNVVINNNMVSRYHCEIIQESDQIKIVDLNSSNGTFVNGRRVYGATYLKSSDNVCVHNIPIRWQNYFVNNHSKNTSKVLPIIFGVLGCVLLLIAIVYLLVSYSATNNDQFVYIEETLETYQSPPKTIPNTPALRQQSFYIKLRDSETFTLSDGTKISASLSNLGLGDVTLKISWYGKTPTKLSWRFDGSGMSPTSNVIYAKKNGDTYSLSEWVYFDWTSDNPTVRGVSFTIYPISEEDRKYER